MEFGAKGFQITGLEFWSLVSHSFIHSFIPRNILLRTRRLGNTAKERAGAERVYSSIGKPATGRVYQQVHLTVTPIHANFRQLGCPDVFGKRSGEGAARHWLLPVHERPLSSLAGHPIGPRTRPGARAGRQVPRRSGDGRDAPFLLDGPRAVLNVSGNRALKAPRARPGRTSRPEVRRPLAPGRAGGNGGPAAAAHLAPGDEGRRRVHRRVLRPRRKSLCAASP